MCLYFVHVVTHSQLEHEGLQCEDQLEVVNVIQVNSYYLDCGIILGHKLFFKYQSFIVHGFQ